ncbi:MAG TPA: amino acid permease [Bacteroidetes bacterium]|nr:amino acid permease [Bacteroidota bacterium]
MKKLERSLSLPYVVAIGIGGMLGSGIFVLPGLAAAKTGPSVWIAYLLAALCVLPAALSKAELATSMPTSGGTYVFVERTLGPIFGTISGIGLWLSLLLKSSFALVGFGAYLLVLADVPLKATAISFLGLIMLLNIFGVKKVGKVQLVVVILSVLGLLLVLLFGVPSVEPENLSPLFTDGKGGLFTATAFVFVSYAGVTKVAAIAEEIKNPNRNLPLAMFIALGFVSVIYVSVTFTLVGNVPVGELSKDIRPIFTLAERLGGRIAGIAAAVLGVITLISMANSGVLAASRFPFAMSRDRLLPGVLRKVHPRFLTPVVTIVLTCLVMALVILTLDVEKIAKLASAFMVMMFIAVNASVIVLRETGVQWYDPPYRSPFYPFVQLFGIVSGIVLLVYLGLMPLLALLAITVIGALIYIFYGNKQSSRSGVLKLYGHRPALFMLYKKKEARARTSAVNLVDAKIKAANLDGALTDNAQVVVPLFGKERSAEMLVEMGAALSKNSKIQVVNITEVPDQLMLDALLEDDKVTTSLNRRITAMAEDRSLDVDFDAAVTHELVKTIHAISDQTHCRWLVMGWDGRAGEGIFVRNPVGWLVTHVNSNFALFKDRGVRYVRRILVARHPNKNDVEFIRYVDRIARYHGAEVTLMRVIDEDISEKDFKEIKKNSEILISHFEAPCELVLIKGKSPVKLISEASAGFDLLVTGRPREGSWRRILFGSKDKFVESAVCSVLRLTVQRKEGV